MTVGEKIKKIRTIMKLTQKELGQKLGFSNSTADVRIRQYESNKMVPKSDKLAQIACALNVDISALSDININSIEDIMHTFFELEENYDVEIEKNDSGYKLSFDKSSSQKDLLYALDAWYNAKQKYLSDSISDEKANTDYKIWKLRYPIDTKDNELLDINKVHSLYNASVNDLKNKNFQITTFKDIMLIFEDMFKLNINITFSIERICTDSRVAVISYQNSQLLSLTNMHYDVYTKYLYAIEYMRDIGMNINILSHTNNKETYCDYHITNPQIVAMVEILQELQKNITDGSYNNMQTIHEYKSALKWIDVPIKDFL